MKKYDNIIIGFGKGGKTIAGALAKNGQKTALIEKSPDMYGGTCINVACIPSKFLENSAQKAAFLGNNFEERAKYYKNIIHEKRELTKALRQKNYDKVAIDAGADVLTGSAEFLDARHVRVTYADGTSEELEGTRFFINTGARPFIPDIPGINGNPYVYTSETLMDLDQLPKKLAIIGGGYIGVEFASYYANFGSSVTIIQTSDKFLPREDEEVAAAAMKSMENRGITILKNTQIKGIGQENGKASLSLSVEGKDLVIDADAVLAATGRRPNLEGLHPEAAGVSLTSRGAVMVDEHLKTTAENIWAMGDVTGGLQFTYISLDDSRIVKSQLLGDGSRTTGNRGAVPYSIFIDPPFSRVGMTEKEAREAGYDVKVTRLAAAAVPKAKVLKKTDGLFKAVIDAKTDKILGAHLFGAESHEIINIIKVVIDAGLPYTVLRDGIFTHPTMAEALNDLF